MATEIEFCLLGPATVRVGGALVAVPAGKQRAVLAALLLNAGRVVSLDELTEVLWKDPPPTARAAIRNHVKRLRQTLGPVAGSRVSTGPRGYLIRVGTGELDISRFQAHLDAARAAARDAAWRSAAAEARAALALWRGEPLAGADSDLLAAREVPRLGELRLEALETRIRADIALGQYAQVVAELRQLAGAYPAREQLHGLLMLALYRDHPDHARAEYGAALRLATQTGDKYQQARAHHGLGQACHASGGPAGACHHWQQALALCTELGTPEAEQVRDEIGTVDRDRYIEASIRAHVGDARHAVGELPQAWQQALEICDDIHHPDADKVRDKFADTDG